MDPNEALTSILCGHMISDHCDALRDWFLRGGFEPEVLMPCDKHLFFAAHCERQYGNHDERRVKANGIGIWTYSAAEDDWHLVGRWGVIEQLPDTEDY